MFTRGLIQASPRLLCFALLMLSCVALFASCGRAGVDLRNENINGIRLLTKRNDALLSKAFGRLTREIGAADERLLEYTTGSYMVYVSLNRHREIVNIGSGAAKANPIKTGKNVGPHSLIQDVIQAYGPDYAKKPYQDFMGSGDGYFIVYTDKTHRIMLQFEVNTGYAPSVGDYKREPEDRVANVELSSY